MKKNPASANSKQPAETKQESKDSTAKTEQKLEESTKKQADAKNLDKTNAASTTKSEEKPISELPKDAEASKPTTDAANKVEAPIKDQKPEAEHDISKYLLMPDDHDPHDQDFHDFTNIVGQMKRMKEE